MSFINPIATTDTEQFVVGESDFAGFCNFAYRSEGCAILFCRSGHAEVTVNQVHGHVERNTLILLLPGAMVLLTDRSADFSMTFCAFSRELFAEASFRLEPSFFQYLMGHPISYPTERRVEGVEIWLQMAAYTYRDKENIFRNTIIRNRLQNVLLEIYDKRQRYRDHHSEPVPTTSRQTELFQRFIALVHEHCSEQREVTFYADKLCISTRYLSSIVRTIAHSSAKEIIDHSVMLELKMLLQSTDLSVQEIAYKLHFPDQSYLGRYFKKHAGVSPTEYRSSRSK